MYYLFYIFQIVIIINIFIVFLYILDKLHLQPLKPLWWKCIWGIFCFRLLLPIPVSTDLFANNQHPVTTFIFLENSISTETIDGIVPILKDNSELNVAKSAASDAFKTPTFSHIKTTLLVIWLLGTLFLFRLHASEYQHMKKLYIETAEVLNTKQLKMFQEKLQKEYKLFLEPEILIQNDLASPILLGYIHPKLLIPDCRFSFKEQEFILRHELNHAKYFDQWYKLLFTITCDIYWFIPLFRLMKRMAYEDMEYVCDQRAMEHQDIESRKTYAKMILKTSSKDFMLAAQLSAHKNSVKKRIELLFNTTKKYSVSLMLILCLFFMLANFSFLPKTEKNNETEQSEISNENSEEVIETHETTEFPSPTEDMVIATREEVFSDIDSNSFLVMKERMKTANLNLEQMVINENLFTHLENADESYWDEIINGKTFKPKNFLEHIKAFRECISNSRLLTDFDYLISNLTAAIENHDSDAFKQAYHIIHDMDYFLFRYGPYDIGIYVKDKSTVNTYYGTLHVFE